MFFFLLGYLLIANIFANAANFSLPESFLGLWIGTPQFNALGPFSNIYAFSISKSPAGDYLMEDNIAYDNGKIGYQRFYVEGYGDTAGSMWYCGAFYNYTNYVEQAGSSRLNGFKATAAADNSVTFCLDTSNKNVTGSPLHANTFKKDCVSCECANWTLVYNPENEILSSQMSMSGSDGHTPSKHLWVELKRHADGPSVSDDDMPPHGGQFTCDFSEGGRDSEPVDRGCPFHHHKTAAPSNIEDTDPKEINAKERGGVIAYRHCYVLNKATNYQLQWTLEGDILHIAVSAATKSTSEYVAIGFRPLSRDTDNSVSYLGTGRHMNFGMQGADIVVGSVDAGVRQMYAALYTGPPDLSPNNMKIDDAKVSYSDGITVLSFSRHVVDGYLYNKYNIEASIVSGMADILWAVGYDSSDAENTCQYHENRRGLRYIDWENPEIAMKDVWSC